MDGFWAFPWGMSGQEIYDNFHNGKGPDRLVQAADVVKDLIKNYENRFDSIKALTEKMESAWQGEASGAAQRGAGPLAIEHGLAAPDMNTAQRLVRSQVTVFESSRSAVVPIPPEPEKPGFWDNVFSLGGAGETYETKRAEYNAANDHNVTVMSSYEGVTDTNTSGMPQSYGRITPDYSAIGVMPPKPPPPPPPPPPPVVPPGTRDPRQPGTGTTQPPGTQTQQPPRPTGPTDPNGPSRPNVPPQQTDPGHYLPPDPVRPGPGPGPGSGQNPYGPGQGFGPGYLPAAGFGPTGGGGADSTGRGGTGAGGRGPGGAAGGFADEGGRQGARGGAAGMGAGAAAAEAAAARGAGAGGRGGMGGMPMGGGGGRGQGGEDGEHQRPSFLVEADPDETFGTDEVTAPPVIGE